MSDGIYAAASGLEAQQAKLDSVANDIANVNTTGYRSQRLGFQDLLYDSEQGVPVGGGVGVIGGGLSTEAGSLTATGDPLSLAIEGDGFFQVKLPTGEIALTRSGDFRLDAKRQVVNADGDLLQPPLTIPADVDVSKLSISSTGVVSAAGKTIGKITLMTVPAPGSLTAAGSGLYLANTASGKAVAVKTQAIVQGSLEGSNVDLASSMVQMIEAQRAYEMASSALKTQDQMMELANGIRK